MQIDVAYPDRAAERRILIETTGDTAVEAKSANECRDLMAAQRLVRRPSSRESVVEAILDLVSPGAAGRRDPKITQHIAWVLAPARRRLDCSRPAPAPSSAGGYRLPSTIIVALAVPVLKHRMALTSRARRRPECERSRCPSSPHGRLTDGESPASRQK